MLNQRGNLRIVNVGICTEINWFFHEVWTVKLQKPAGSLITDNMKMAVQIKCQVKKKKY